MPPPRPPSVPTSGTANSAAETSDGEYVEANSECGHETNEASDGATGTTEGTEHGQPAGAELLEGRAEGGDRVGVALCVQQSD